MSDETATIDEQQIHAAAKEVIDRLEKFDEAARRRVFQKALGFFQLELLPSGPRLVPPDSSREAAPTQPGPGIGSAAHFAERPELPPKSFMFQKQPHTDIERITCLAYYLTHYRDTRQFKTLDLSKLNTEAAQAKFSNTAFAVVNASNAGLLVAAGRGFKQLSAVGEHYVEALPDRDGAKEVLANARVRRRRKTPKDNGETK